MPGSCTHRTIKCSTELRRRMLGACLWFSAPASVLGVGVEWGGHHSLLMTALCLCGQCLFAPATCRRLWSLPHSRDKCLYPLAEPEVGGGSSGAVTCGQRLQAAPAASSGYYTLYGQSLDH